MHDAIKQIIAKNSYDGMLEITIDELAGLILEEVQNQSQTLTCVYCGHQYPPGTPPSNHAALTAHIAQCDKHPMKSVIVALTRLVDAVAEEPSIDHARVSHRLSTAMALARQFSGSAH